MTTFFSNTYITTSSKRLIHIGYKAKTRVVCSEAVHINKIVMQGDVTLETAFAKW